MIAAPESIPLRRSFFDRPVLEVAPELLGRVLVRTTDDGPIALRLTEVEAYAGPADPGSHAYRGRTDRNAVMFGPPGHAYVYFTYGMWHCLNIVCGPGGNPSGILLRGGEIIEGAELARTRRVSSRRPHDLAQGPARLATALDVDRTLNGADVCPDGPADSPFRILAGTPVDRAAVRNGPRTGVGGEGAAHPWRFYIDGDPTVSPYRAHAPRRRAQGGAKGVEPNA
ncbi:DNA-3-methyladenine glycosylase [Streptomyces sp. NPDC088354]|uniref:DNA-3-methyladenine glycosylase n=1 Tax=unclassified Streptomyces TaxID=2593676 RepID=UPI0029A63D1D|nr:DNA-3-methyladenine glycosylase [Streptomyces sp. MI02-7b]MDX3074488.1 DNA-3-methyladenine glycosylase [Streptomyces sp. MI02-7b]